MAYWSMLEKLRGHRCLLPDEEPVAAIYGLGEAVLRMADGAAEGLAGAPGSTSSLDGPDIYSDEFLAATGGRHRDGCASLVVGNGVLGLTERRLLWFRKATVVGRPRDLTAEFPLTDVVEAERLESMVRVVFADESIAGLHVPRSQKPETFVAELNGRVTP